MFDDREREREREPKIANLQSSCKHHIVGGAALYSRICDKGDRQT